MSPYDPTRSAPTDPLGRRDATAAGDDGARLLWAALGARSGVDPAWEDRLSAPRRRLAERVAASARASRAMVTTRHSATAMARANDVARLQTLYLAAEGPRRPGEPHNVLLIELAPGGTLPLDPPAAGVQREWLLVRGGVAVGGAASHVTLTPLDFHIEPASLDPAAIDPRAVRLDADEQGALLFLRESLTFPAPGSAPRTVRDADAPWKPFALRLERRVLWKSGALGAMLYRAAPGAQVPHHGHRHDEECLVLRGETFQDEVLLREGDYQLAPAGSEHHCGSTDTGAIFYIHGDLHLDLKAPAGLNA